MPPKVKPEQALHFAESLARGTPHRGKIAATVISDTVRELVQEHQCGQILRSKGLRRAPNAFRPTARKPMRR
jgi:hypothetical protein